MGVNIGGNMSVNMGLNMGVNMNVNMYGMGMVVGWYGFWSQIISKIPKIPNLGLIVISEKSLPKI